MLKLYKLNSDEYLFINHRSPSFCSTLDKVVTVMKKNGIDQEEIDLALEQMTLHSHNVAEFGVFNRTFIFSKKVA